MAEDYCPVCRERIAQPIDGIACPSCGKLHHRACIGSGESCPSCAAVSDESVVVEESAEVSDGPVVVEEPGLESPLAREVEAKLADMNTRKRTFLRNAAMLVVSLAIFVGAGLLTSSWISIIIVVGVIFIHELGHFVAMKLFGYRDVHIFFIPFLGAATSGSGAVTSGAKRALVCLLGPLPGIVLGIVSAIGYFVTEEPILIEITRAFLILNALNLLPIGFLDGARVLESSLFSRNKIVEVIFRILAAGGFVGLAILLRSIPLGIFAFFSIVFIRIGYIVSSIAFELKKEMPCPDDSDLDSVPREYVGKITDMLTKRLSKEHHKPAALATHVQAIWQRIHIRPPSVGATIGIVALYMAALLVAIGGSLAFEVALRQVDGVEVQREAEQDPQP